MDKKNFNLFFSGAVILIVIFGMYFVFATMSAPSRVIFGGNTTANYDEGVFTVNWSNATEPFGENATHNIYVNFSNGTIFQTIISTVNYSFSNTAVEANYTFIVEAVNSSDTSDRANASTLWMYVDLTAPVITLQSYTNLTKKKNTATLDLNISVIDAFSGETGSMCLVDVNGTSNQSIDVSANGWCNFTADSALNLTASTDANYTIKVYVNDTVNNLGLNDTYALWMDSTAPVATFTCSPSTIGNGATTTCTCTGTDTGGSGVNTSLTTAPVTITSSSTFGIFTTGTSNCTITDYAGNTHNATGTYTVASDSATDSTSSTSKTPMRWTGTFVINEEQFSEGNTKQVAVNKRLRFKVKNINHHLGVLELTETTAKIEVSSTPQEATLSVGDTRKFDVSEDGYYDLVVTLNSILDGKADLTIKSISELITVESEIGEQEKEEVAKGGEEIIQEDSIFKKWWFWLIIVLIVVGAKVSYNYKKNKE